MNIQDILILDKEEIIRRHTHGESTNSISKSYSCNPGTIWYFLDSLGLLSNTPRSNNYGMVDSRKDEIVTLFQSGVSAYAISKQLSISKPVILRKLRKWGLDTSKKRTRDPSKPMLKDRYDELRELHSQGLSQEAIAAKMGYSGSKICTTMQLLGLESHDLHIKYSVNEDYFRVIDTEAKAYTLGWLYSDGNITSGGKIRLNIVAKDREILDWMKQEMEYTGEITKVQSKENDSRRQKQVLLTINRKCLTKQLERLGCFPNKCMKLQFPTSDQVPNHLLHHFVRGYFDGDGCMTQRYANIVGTLRFIYELENKLPCQITNIYQRYKDRHPEDSSHQLFICRKIEIIKFGLWLYRDSTIYLKRKYDKFRCIIN